MAELVPLSPEWWVKRLDKELTARQDDYDLYRSLVDDEHTPANTVEQSRKYREMAGLATTNLCGLVVEATGERMEIEGFRVGDEPDSDADAWQIWQDSDFDAGSAEQITHALVYGRSFVSVLPPDGDVGPKLLGEDPRQVIVAYSSDGLRNRLAALKVFQDEWTDRKFATLYLPNAIYRFEAEDTKRKDSPYVARTMPQDQSPVSSNPLGEVPFFELRNRPHGRTRSEIAPIVIPQRRLNQAIFNTDAVSEYGAFRQKWATGIEIPLDDDGKPNSPFNANIAQMFIGTPAKGQSEPARFGDFNATDLSGYLDLGREIAGHIARLSRVPITYFLANVSNVSAEALELMVSGLVRKCRRRVKGYEPAFEGALGLAFRSMGDKRGLNTNIDTRWASMETRSVAQDADAAVKLTQGDNPVITPQTAQEKYLGMSQTERDRDASWRLENGVSRDLAGLLNEPEPNPANQPAQASAAGAPQGGIAANGQPVAGTPVG